MPYSPHRIVVMRVWGAVLLARRSRQLLIVSLLFAAPSCDVTGPEPSISLNLSASSLVLVQGDVGKLTVSVTRRDYGGAVRLSLFGLPAGASAMFDPESLSAVQSQSALSISIPINAVPDTATLRLEVSGDGVATQSAELTLTTGVKGDFTLRVVPETLVVAQGGGDIASALVDATGGFGADVAVTATGAPAGMTVSPGGTATPLTRHPVEIAASASAATGYYTIALQGTTPGLPPRTAQLVLSIIAPRPTTRVSVPRCDFGSDWFGYKNEGFPWTHVAAASNASSFDATDRVAIAEHFSYFATTLTNIRFTTAGELALMTSRRCGTKTLAGTAMTNAYARVHAAWSTDDPAAGAPNFVLTDLPAGPLDFVAVQYAPALTPNAVILRRSVDVPQGTPVPTFDFLSGEALAPATMTLSVAGSANGESVVAWSRLWTANGTHAFLGSQSANAPVTSIGAFAIPDAARVAGDVQEASVSAQSIAGGRRETRVFFESAGDRALTLPVSLATAMCTSVANAPYARYRVRLPSQDAYGAAVAFGFLGYPPDLVPLMSVQLSATSGWFGGTPTVWDLTIPDLSQANGFLPSWMIAAGSNTTCSASAMSAMPPEWTAKPNAGDVVNSAFRGVNVTP